MRINTIIVTSIITLAFLGSPVYAQVQSVEDIEVPTPQFEDHGGKTPWFWIGLQTVFGMGYNFETTAYGFRNYGGTNSTYASFNLAFVDSHYQTPKFYEVPRELDNDAWTAHFVLLNFTSRLNSWNSGNTVTMENNGPAWLAEITGKGARIGFFTQAGNLVGGIFDSGVEETKEASREPVMRISGGNKVLDLKKGQLGKLYYDEVFDTSNTVTRYGTSDGALWYTGYEKKELWNVFLTMLSEGNVNSDVSGGKNKGFAGVIDFDTTPFGLFPDDEKPFVFNISGNAIFGFGWKTTTESVGFGLKGDVDVLLGNNLILSPVLAFDGKLNSSNDFSYKIGGGLTFQFSGMRWVNDEWGDLLNPGYNAATSTFNGNTNFASLRYENSKILKYAYAQVYAAYSEARDLNILFRVEEPDGEIGFHDKLGFMAELRLYNLTGKTEKSSWEAQARVSWDFNIKQYLVTPYLRGYIDSNQIVKLRIGAYANFIPYTGFEIAYTSANLNNGSASRPAGFNSSYTRNLDAGRIELLIILKSDDIRPTVPKRMSDWNYPNTIQDY